jgi:transcriptional regulator with XRE-family HTH domain
MRNAAFIYRGACPVSAKQANPRGEGTADAGFVARIHEIVERSGGISMLSRKSRLSRAVIHKYLNGESDPSRARLVALARAADVDLEWLATGRKAAAGTGLPERKLDDDELRELITRRVETAFSSHGQEARARYIDRLHSFLRSSENAEEQLVLLGGSLFAISQENEEERRKNHPRPLLDFEENLFRARDPLFRLWCWRQGGIPGDAAKRDDLSPAQAAEFRDWLADLRPLDAAELIHGVWEGVGSSYRRLFRLLRRPARVFRAEQVFIPRSPATPGASEGYWTIHDERVAVVDFRGGETIYLVTEAASGKSFAIVYEGERTVHAAIIPADRSGDDSDVATEFRTRQTDIRAAGPASGEDGEGRSSATA